MSEGPELTALADALRGLAPHAGALDRDELLYRFGQASVPRPRRWPLFITTALSSGLALGLGAVLLFRPPSTHTGEVTRVVTVTVEREVRVPAPQPVPPYVEEAPAIASESVPSAPSGRYRQVEEQLLRWGLDGVGMPSPQPRPGPRMTVESLTQPF